MYINLSHYIEQLARVERLYVGSGHNDGSLSCVLPCDTHRLHSQVVDVGSYLSKVRHVSQTLWLNP